jgi:hypothetical protein
MGKEKKDCIDWLIDWCLKSTLAIFQLYRGVRKITKRLILIFAIKVNLNDFYESVILVHFKIYNVVY